MKALLGLGGYFTNPIDSPEDIIRHAYEKEIRIFDTSPAYGESEKQFGNALKEYDRNSYLIYTKTKASNSDMLLSSFFGSLKNLKVDFVEVLFGHSFIDDMFTLNNHLKVIEEMKNLKKSGLIDSIGVSGHSVEAAMYVLDNNLVDYIMVPHSIMYLKFDRVIEKANQQNIKVVTMKNFGSGILLGGPNENSFKENVTLQDIMNFSSWSGADLIIPAARSIAQLDQIINCYEKSEEMTFKQEIKLKNKITEILGEDFCRFCNECRPCPKYGWMMSQPGILKSMLYHEKFNTDMKDAYSKYKLNIKDCKDCDSECNKMCPFGINIKEQMQIADSILKEITNENLSK
jgi:predicted aldo/keto reductase-like oxidoreductase